MSNWKRIANNTIYLYIRMGVGMLLALYTSRIVLQNLGINGFGVYSIVWGVMVLLSFLNHALAFSSNRYLNVALSRENPALSQRVFASSMSCQLTVAMIIILLAETVGLWFINCELNIPSDTLPAANIVFQLCLVSTIANTINTPYLAAITAHERMGFIAAISILSSVLKVGAAFLIILVPQRLVFYAAMMTALTVAQPLINRYYCQRNFGYCRFRTVRCRRLYRSMMKFAGWNILRAGSAATVSQGCILLVNLFGGIGASAAMGIAGQVNGVAFKFADNAQIACNPQITQSVYRRCSYNSNSLIINASRLSAILFAVIAVPVIANLKDILPLWLTEVPEQTATFCISIIFATFLYTLSGPLYTAIFALGNVCRFQITASIIWIVSIPVAWGLLALGLPVYFVFAPKIIAEIIVIGYSIRYLSKHTLFHSRAFAMQALRNFGVFGASCAVSYVVAHLIDTSTIPGLITSILASLTILAAGVQLFLLTPYERRKIMHYVGLAPR